jgi:hypothetical protein
MGTSVGAAIDYIVTSLPALLTAAIPTAVVADNEPALTSDSLVVIGRTDPENALGGDGTQLIVSLGANTRLEEYVIPCFVQVYRPGPAQKTARDAAVTLFDVVARLIASDPTLGGVLLKGRYAFIDKMQLIQTRDSADTGSSGAMRLAVITFNIHANNLYNP